MIYDIDKDLSDEDVIDYIYQQNLSEHGTRKEEMSGSKILYRVGRREAETVNLVCGTGTENQRGSVGSRQSLYRL